METDSFISKIYIYVMLVVFGTILVIGVILGIYVFRSWLCVCDKLGCCKDTFEGTKLPKILKRLPEIKYSLDKNKYNQENCVICLSNFKTQIQIRVLECEHIFHSKCIVAWFIAKNNNICPICNISPHIN